MLPCLSCCEGPIGDPDKGARPGPDAPRGRQPEARGHGDRESGLHGHCPRGSALGRCQLLLAMGLGASVPSQSRGDGRRVTKDGEAPGERPQRAGKPSQQLLGQEQGLVCWGMGLDPTRRAPCRPRQSPRTPTPALGPPGPPRPPSTPTPSARAQTVIQSLLGEDQAPPRMIMGCLSG